MASKQFRPRILGFISEQASAWLVAVLAFAAGAALTIMLALANFELYQRQLRQRFDLLAGERFSRIQERLDGQTNRLEALRRFFLYSDEVLRSEFDGFVEPMLVGTQAYTWTPRVTQAEREAFEERARKHGPSGFSIRELDQNGQFRPAAARDEYFPVLFIQTISRKPPPFGFDVYSEQIRHESIERARMLGGIVATPRVELVSLNRSDTRGILLMAPVSLPKPVAGGPPSELKGFVMAIISLDQMMNEGLPSQDNLAMSMLDLSSQGDPDLLYQSPSVAADSELHVSTLLSMGDRDYLLEVRPTEAFLQSNQSMAGSVALLGGLLSLMLSALLYSLISQRQRALLLVDQRTRELRVREQQLRVTHGQLRNVLNAATEVAIIATDLNGVISTFNVGAQKMLGYSDEEVLGKLCLKDMHRPAELEARARELSEGSGQTIPAAQVMFVDATEEGNHLSREWTFQRQDGSTLVVNMLVTAVRDDQDQWIGYLAVCIDITEHKRVYEALEARDQLLKKLSSQVPGGIYQYQQAADGSSRFTYASVGMCELFELSEEALLQDAEVLLRRTHPADIVRLRDSIRISAEQSTPWSEEYRVELPGKGLRWVRGAATLERLPDGGSLWHGFISDISDLKRVEQELRALSVTDVLTGAYNRRYLQERLHAELARIDRHGGDLSVIMLDIDHFKRINDKYGHAVGDSVLQAISRRISQRLRCDDVFCRMGGEEFMVLCPGTQAAQAYQLALGLREALRNQPVDVVGQVTASFGIASWQKGEGIDALLVRADSGVYAAKQAGRDRVEPELAIVE
ncbi:diguanylate cyclase [Pseudomonas sp. NPDC089734]|uniref:sensor domain-containing diguanylate cyclase n=1 Tax=Pseudomonas sp. NPDC089734 TaxID=3364469 RepID=UPI00380A4585